MALPKFPIKKPDSPYFPVSGPPPLDRRIMELMSNKLLEQFIKPDLTSVEQRELQKQLQHALMYGTGAGALHTIVPDTTPPKLSRYRLIVELEITASSEMAARRQAKHALVANISDIVTVLMCEPVVGGDVNETLP